MADLFMLLGMRYLRILCGNADRQAQNGTDPQPEEISRRWSSGVAGAALLGAIYAAATGGKIAEYALICAVGALISMVGDLAASAIKRNQGIKDYGKLIPGHGGILDRFDSVIFTAPAIYFLAKLVLGI